MSKTSRRRLFLSLTFISAMVTWACEKTVSYRGQPMVWEIAQKLCPGKSTKEDALKILGTPAFISPFSRGNAWCYLYQKIESVGDFSGTVTQHLVCILSFDHAGKLKDVVKIDQMNPVAPIENTTDHSAHREEVLKNIFQRLGKFNKAPI